jgi:putative ABC transport system ATP-binding protein
MLSLDTISKTYRKGARSVPVLHDLSLTVARGEFVSVLGPSGCGKTTILLTAGGLLTPDAGQVTLDGTDPYALAPEARAAFRAEHVGFVFQQFHLVPYLSVLDNVMTAGLAAGDTSAEVRDRAKILIAKFGLSERTHHCPAELSVGERQRVALARALLNSPSLLLADEPTGNLDDDNAHIVLDTLRQFAHDGGAVLLVTHDQRTADLADKEIRL